MKIRIALLLLTLLIALGIKDAAAEQYQGLFVYDCEGKITLTRNRKSQPLKADTQLLPEDILKTEAESNMQLTMLDNVSLKFGEFSHVEIKSNYQSELHILFYNGEALVNTKSLKTGNSINIESPSAIIKAKLPSQFWCRVTTDENGKKITTLAVKKGTVGVFFKEGSADINILENQGIDIVEGGFISNPRQATEEELDKADTANKVYISSSADG